jgi:hypothetical protein
MIKDILKKITQQIDNILEHEDGLSKHDKEELNRLLLEKAKIEKELRDLSAELDKLTQ